MKHSFTEQILEIKSENALQFCTWSVLCKNPLHLLNSRKLHSQNCFYLPFRKHSIMV
uniref:Uncharacterized protein n=1 Tax=Anguilla anguilla TaxID=7936 RepID=A0A0E9U2G7_ANGAN